MSPPSFDELKSMLKERLSPRKYLHSLGVCDAAIALAMRWGCSPDSAANAALLHDMAKETKGRAVEQATLRANSLCTYDADREAQRGLTNALLQPCALCDKIPAKAREFFKITPSDFASTNPALLHALTGAAFAYNLGFRDDVVLAVRWHTTARRDMLLLEQIIYLADKMEVFRTHYPELPSIRAAAFTDLALALLLAVKRTIRKTAEEGLPLDINSSEALDWLKFLKQSQNPSQPP